MPWFLLVAIGTGHAQVVTLICTVSGKASMPKMKKVKSFHYQSDEASSYLRRERWETSQLFFWHPLPVYNPFHPLPMPPPSFTLLRRDRLADTL